MELRSPYSNTTITVHAPHLQLYVGDETRTGASRQRQVRLSPGGEADVVTAYLSGTQVTQLAHQHGVHRTTITAILRRAHVPRRQRGMDPEQISEAVQLYRAGWSPARVGERLGYGGTTVRAALLR